MFDLFFVFLAVESSRIRTSESSISNVFVSKIPFIFLIISPNFASSDIKIRYFLTTLFFYIIQEDSTSKKWRNGKLLRI